MFSLSINQQNKVEKFINDLSSDNAYEGAIGGRFTYSFTPTGLGQIVVVKDNISGTELDITEYEIW